MSFYRNIITNLFYRLHLGALRRKIQILFGTLLTLQPTINYQAQTNHFIVPSYGGETYPIVIQRVYINNNVIMKDDEIAIIDTSLNIFNGIVGQKIFNGDLPISAFAYMRTIVGEDTLQGANPGGEITFLAWDNSEREEYRCKAYFQTGGLFGDGFAANIDSLICDGITSVKRKNNTASESSFRFYPNPFSNFINISGSYSQLKSVEIVNILGQRILKRNIESSNQMITISGLYSLPRGVYFLRIVTTILNNIPIYKTIKIFHTK